MAIDVDLTSFDFAPIPDDDDWSNIFAIDLGRWRPELHPRDSHGRFRNAWRMAAGAMHEVERLLAGFNPPPLRSDRHASSYLRGQRGPRTKKQQDTLDYFLSREGNEDIQSSLRGGFDPRTDKGENAARVRELESMMRPLEHDLILSRVMGPDAFGLPPERLSEVEEWTGRRAADAGFSPMNAGSAHVVGAPHIEMRILVPKGTRAIIVGDGGDGPNSRTVILDRNQPIRIGKVQSDGRGGFYALATVAHSRGAKGERPTMQLGRELPVSERSPAIAATPDELERRGLEPDIGPPGPQEQPERFGPTAPAGPTPTARAAQGPAPGPVKPAPEGAPFESKPVPAGEVPTGAGRVTRAGDENIEPPARAERPRTRGQGQVMDEREARLAEREREADRKLKQAQADQARADRMQDNAIKRQERELARLDAEVERLRAQREADIAGRTIRADEGTQARLERTDRQRDDRVLEADNKNRRDPKWPATGEDTRIALRANRIRAARGEQEMDIPEDAPPPPAETDEEAAALAPVKRVRKAAAAAPRKRVRKATPAKGEEEGPPPEVAAEMEAAPPERGVSAPRVISRERGEDAILERVKGIDPDSQDPLDQALLREADRIRARRASEGAPEAPQAPTKRAARRVAARKAVPEAAAPEAAPEAAAPTPATVAKRIAKRVPAPEVAPTKRGAKAVPGPRLDEEQRNRLLEMTPEELKDWFDSVSPPKATPGRARGTKKAAPEAPEAPTPTKAPSKRGVKKAAPKAPEAPAAPAKKAAPAKRVTKAAPEALPAKKAIPERKPKSQKELDAMSDDEIIRYADSLEGPSQNSSEVVAKRMAQAARNRREEGAPPGETLDQLKERLTKPAPEVRRIARPVPTETADQLRDRLKRERQAEHEARVEAKRQPRPRGTGLTPDELKAQNKREIEAARKARLAEGPKKTQAEVEAEAKVPRPGVKKAEAKATKARAENFDKITPDVPGQEGGLLRTVQRELAEGQPIAPLKQRLQSRADTLRRRAELEREDAELDPTGRRAAHYDRLADIYENAASNIGKRGANPDRLVHGDKVERTNKDKSITKGTVAKRGRLTYIDWEDGESQRVLPSRPGRGIKKVGGAAPGEAPAKAEKPRTLADLRKEASTLGVPGRSTMDKDKLTEAIAARQRNEGESDVAYKARLDELNARPKVTRAAPRKIASRAKAEEAAPEAAPAKAARPTVTRAAAVRLNAQEKEDVAGLTTNQRNVYNDLRRKNIPHGTALRGAQESPARKVAARKATTPEGAPVKKTFRRAAKAGTPEPARPSTEPPKTPGGGRVIEFPTGRRAVKRRLAGTPEREVSDLVPHTKRGGSVPETNAPEVSGVQVPTKATKVARPRVRRAAAPAATGEASERVPTTKEEFRPGGAKHVDVRSLPEAEHVDAEDLDDIQRDLNEGKSPGSIAKELRHRAETIEAHSVYLTHNAVSKDETTAPPEAIAEKRRLRAKATRLRLLADGLAATRRPTVRRAAARRAVPEAPAVPEVTRGKIDFARGGAKHLDISPYVDEASFGQVDVPGGSGLDRVPDHRNLIAEAQQRLDEGQTPGQVGRELQLAAARLRSSATIRYGGPPTHANATPEDAANRKATHDAWQKRAKQLADLGGTLEKLQRPRAARKVTNAAPEAPAPAPVAKKAARRVAKAAPEPPARLQRSPRLTAEQRSDIEPLSNIDKARYRSLRRDRIEHDDALAQVKRERQAADLGAAQRKEAAATKRVRDTDAFKEQQRIGRERQDRAIDEANRKDLAPLLDEAGVKYDDLTPMQRSKVGVLQGRVEKKTISKKAAAADIRSDGDDRMNAIANVLERRASRKVAVKKAAPAVKKAAPAVKKAAPEAPAKAAAPEAAPVALTPAQYQALKGIDSGEKRFPRGDLQKKLVDSGVVEYRNGKYEVTPAGKDVLARENKRPRVTRAAAKAAPEAPAPAKAAPRKVAAKATPAKRVAQKAAATAVEAVPRKTTAKKTAPSAERIAKQVELPKNFGEILRQTDPEELKAEVRKLGLGDVEGNNGEEVFDNALKKMIQNRLDELGMGEKPAAKKAARKVAAKAATKKAAKVVPEAAPEGAPKLDQFEQERFDQLSPAAKFRYNELREGPRKATHPEALALAQNMDRYAARRDRVKEYAGLSRDQFDALPDERKKLILDDLKSISESGDTRTIPSNRTSMGTTIRGGEAGHVTTARSLRNQFTRTPGPTRPAKPGADAVIARLDSPDFDPDGVDVQDMLKGMDRGEVTRVAEHVGVKNPKGYTLAGLRREVRSQVDENKRNAPKAPPAAKKAAPERPAVKRAEPRKVATERRRREAEAADLEAQRREEEAIQRENDQAAAEQAEAIQREEAEAQAPAAERPKVTRAKPRKVARPTPVGEESKVTAKLRGMRGDPDKIQAELDKDENGLDVLREVAQDLGLDDRQTKLELKRSIKDVLTGNGRRPSIAPPEVPAKATRAEPNVPENMKDRVRPGGMIGLAHIRKGDRVMVEQANDGSWHPSRKITATPITVDRQATGSQGGRVLIGRDDRGNEIQVGRERGGYSGVQTFRAARPEGAKVGKAAKAAPEVQQQRSEAMKKALRPLKGHGSSDFREGGAATHGVDQDDNFQKFIQERIDAGTAPATTVRYMRRHASNYEEAGRSPREGIAYGYDLKKPGKREQILAQAARWRKAADDFEAENKTIKAPRVTKAAPEGAPERPKVTRAKPSKAAAETAPEAEAPAPAKATRPRVIRPKKAVTPKPTKAPETEEETGPTDIVDFETPAKKPRKIAKKFSPEIMKEKVPQGIAPDDWRRARSLGWSKEKATNYGEARARAREQLRLINKDMERPKPGAVWKARQEEIAREELEGQVTPPEAVAKPERPTIKRAAKKIAAALRKPFRRDRTEAKVPESPDALMAAKRRERALELRRRREEIARFLDEEPTATPPPTWPGPDSLPESQRSEYDKLPVNSKLKYDYLREHGSNHDAAFKQVDEEARRDFPESYAKALGEKVPRKIAKRAPGELTRIQQNAADSVREASKDGEWVNETDLPASRYLLKQLADKGVLEVEEVPGRRAGSVVRRYRPKGNAPEAPAAPAKRAAKKAAPEVAKPERPTVRRATTPRKVSTEAVKPERPVVKRAAPRKISRPEVEAPAPAKATRARAPRPFKDNAAKARAWGTEQGFKGQAGGWIHDKDGKRTKAHGWDDFYKAHSRDIEKWDKQRLTGGGPEEPKRPSPAPPKVTKAAAKKAIPRGRYNAALKEGMSGPEAEEWARANDQSITAMREQRRGNRKIDFFDRARTDAHIASTLDNTLANEGSDRAILHQIDSSEKPKPMGRLLGVPAKDRDRMRKAFETGGREGLRKEIANFERRQGISRIGNTGEVVPFDPEIHRIPGRMDAKKGDPVLILHPGHKVRAPGDDKDTVVTHASVMPDRATKRAAASAAAKKAAAEVTEPTRRPRVTRAKAAPEAAAPEAPAVRRGRRKPGPFDPFDVYSKSGEDDQHLRKRLDALEPDQLRDIIAEHGMDPSRSVSRSRDKRKLVDRIANATRDRTNKGRAFLDKETAQRIVKGVAAKRVARAVTPERPRVTRAASNKVESADDVIANRGTIVRTPEHVGWDIVQHDGNKRWYILDPDGKLHKDGRVSSSSSLEAAQKRLDRIDKPAAPETPAKAVRRVAKKAAPEAGLSPTQVKRLQGLNDRNDWTSESSRLPKDEMDDLVKQGLVQRRWQRFENGVGTNPAVKITAKGKRLLAEQNAGPEAPAKQPRVTRAAAKAAPEAPRAKRPVVKRAAKAATTPESKELRPLANGTRRKSMTNVQEGDVVRGASGARGGSEVPRRVTKVERDGNSITITRDDGSTLRGNANTAVWLGEAPKAEAPAAKKATRAAKAAAPETPAKATRPRVTRAKATPGKGDARELEARRLAAEERAAEAKGMTLDQWRSSRKASPTKRAAQKALPETPVARSTEAPTPDSDTTKVDQAKLRLDARAAGRRRRTADGSGELADILNQVIEAREGDDNPSAFRRAVRQRLLSTPQQSSAEKTEGYSDLRRALSRESFTNPEELNKRLRDELGKRGITMTSTRGAQTRFNPDLHRPLGEDIPDNADVEVVRPGLIFTDEDGTVVTLQKPVVRRLGTGDRESTPLGEALPDTPEEAVQVEKPVPPGMKRFDGPLGPIDLPIERVTTDAQGVRTRQADRVRDLLKDIQQGVRKNPDGIFDFVDRHMTAADVRRTAKYLGVDVAPGDRKVTMRNKVVAEIGRRLGFEHRETNKGREELEKLNRTQLRDMLPEGRTLPKSASKQELIDVLMGDEDTPGSRHATTTPGIDSIRASVEGGTTDVRGLGNGSMGRVTRVRDASGKDLIRKRLKRDWYIGAEEQADSENLVSRVGQAIGAPVPAVYQPKSREVYMDFVHGKLADQESPARIRAAVRSDAGRRLHLLDVITGNVDRHNGNWIIDAEGNPVGIDNSLGFRRIPGSSQGPWRDSSLRFEDGEIRPAALHGKDPFMRHYKVQTGTYDRDGVSKMSEKWSDTVPWSTEELQDARRKIVDLEPEFKQLGREDWHRESLERLDALIKRSKPASGPSVTGRIDRVADRVFRTPEGRRQTPEGVYRPANPRVISGLGQARTKDILSHDTGPEGIPVRRFSPRDNPGYTIHEGTAWRRDGVTYIVEHDKDSLDAAVTVRNLMAAHHASLPAEGKKYQRGYIWAGGSNPQDAYWGQKYGIKDMTSVMSGGDGELVVWGSGFRGGATQETLQSVMNHEYGHNVDTLARSTRISSSRDWLGAGESDRRRSRRPFDWQPFVGQAAWLVSPPEKDSKYPNGINPYAQSDPMEDFGESMALYLQGPIGQGRVTPNGPVVQIWFRDLYPARAAVLDRLFPSVRAQQREQIASVRRRQ